MRGLAHYARLFDQSALPEHDADSHAASPQHPV